MPQNKVRSTLWTLTKPFTMKKQIDPLVYLLASSTCNRNKKSLFNVFNHFYN